MKLLTDRSVHHRYLMNGAPQNCAYCREPLQGDVLRRGTSYYCNELCADAAPARVLQ